MRNIVDQASETASNAAGKASEIASNLGAKASDAASNVKDRASDLASQAKERASEAAHYLGESPIASSAGRIPTDAFLIAAAASIVGSLTLKLMGRQKDADFVGHWAPTLISLGLLSKLVEHDRHSTTPAPAKRSRKSAGAEDI